jgi:hypothetical protein
MFKIVLGKLFQFMYIGQTYFSAYSSYVIGFLRGSFSLRFGFLTVAAVDSIFALYQIKYIRLVGLYAVVAL